MSGLLVAVDAGGSKTDVVVLDATGELVAHRRGDGASPQLIGLPAAIGRVTALVADALPEGAAVRLARLCISGLDLPLELERYAEAIAAEPWTPADTVADNDLFALLRAGTDHPDAAAVICGTGINALAVRSDGATARFAALGGISGDWGGGIGLGQAALWHAARAVDRRGPATSLVDVLPAVFARPDVDALIAALHFGEISSIELHRAVPAVLAASADGDAVARSLVERQAEEIVAMASSALDRLALSGSAVPVVLGGGIVRSGDPVLTEGIRARLAERMPHAWTETVDAAPIVGAGLLALDAAGADAGALERARSALSRL